MWISRTRFCAFSVSPFASARRHARRPLLRANWRTAQSVEILEDRCLLSTLADTGFGPVGPEQIVNDNTTDNTHPSVGMAANGNYVIGWRGVGAADDSGIYMQMFDAQGNPQFATEVLVNTTTANNQYNPYVAMAPDGRFAVAWNVSGAGNSKIFVQRFDAQGNRIGGEINGVTRQKGNEGVTLKGLAMDAAGNFAVLYEPVTGSGFGLSWGPISVQRFNANGASEGSAISVADPNLADPPADIAMAPDGQFIVTWHEYGIEAQRYNADGSPNGNHIFVTEAYNRFPSVAINSQGDFVVSWLDVTNGDFSWAKAYKNGNEVGEYQLGTGTGMVALDDQGNVAFIHSIEAGIGLQIFNINDPAPPTDDIIVNTTLTGTAGDQLALAMAADGDFVVAWGNSDGNTRAQRYQAPPAVPSLSINDVNVTEGDSGSIMVSFTVTRSGDLSQMVTVEYATADGSATAGSDYVAIPTTQLVFNANEISKTISVVINGDIAEEGNETFFVNLSNATGATIVKAQGVGTILDDDTVAAQLSVDSISPNTANPGDQLTVTITGTGFVDGAIVDFGERVTVQSVTYVSSTELRVAIKVHPKATVGLRDVTVTNPDGSSASFPNGFGVGTIPATVNSLTENAYVVTLIDAAFLNNLEEILDV